MADRPLLLAAAATVAAASLFSVKAVLVKLAYRHGVDPAGVIGLRMALALPVFALLAWRAERAAPTAIAPGQIAVCAGLGVLGYHVASWLDFLGLARIDAALERTVLSLYPLLVVLAAVARRRRSVDRRLLLALAGTSLGIVASFGRDIDPAHASAVGVALVAASAAAYAGFLVGSETPMRELGGARFMAWAMTAACLSASLHALIAHPAGFAVSPAALGLGALLAYGCTVAPAFLTAIGLRGLGPARYAVLSATGPFATALAAWAALGERPSAGTWLGLALATIAGVALSTAPRPAPAVSRSAAG